MEQQTGTGTALTKVDPQTDTEVMNFYLEALRLQAYAESRVILTLEDSKLATADLTLIARVQKGMETKRKEYLQPFNDHVKETNEVYRTLMMPIVQADRITRDKLTAYMREQERIRREQEEINRLRIEAAQREATMNNGEISEPVNLVEVVSAPKKVNTDMGSAGQRDNWTYTITDFSLLPDDYKLPNISALNAFAKSTKGTRAVPGVRIFNDPIIVVRPR